MYVGIFIGYTNFEKEKKYYQDKLGTVENDKQHQCYNNSFTVVYANRVFNTCCLMVIDSFIYFDSFNNLQYLYEPLCQKIYSLRALQYYQCICYIKCHTESNIKKNEIRFFLSLPFFLPVSISREWELNLILHNCFLR